MEILSVHLLLIFFLIPLLLFLYILSPSQKQSTNKGFKSYPIIGALPEFIQNRHRFLDWTTETLSQCPTNIAVFHRPGKVHGVIAAYPLNVEYMLKTNFENYPKGDRFITLLEDFLGQGIFNSDGNCSNTVNSTVPLAAEVFKKAGAYDPECLVLCCQSQPES